MNFLHADFWIGADDVVIVTLDRQANAMLLDDANFNAYRHGRSFSYYGGWVTKSPARLSPPHHSHWHVVVDMGASGGIVRAGIRVAGPSTLALL